MMDSTGSLNDVVLVINSGISFLEFQCFGLENPPQRLSEGLVSKIGTNHSKLEYRRYDGHELIEKEPLRNTFEAIQLVAERCGGLDFRCPNQPRRPIGIGHRIIHGGEKFHSSTLVTEEVKRIIGECASLAPLHNPANLAAIEACEKIFPETPNVAVFDTAFHHSMPPSSYLYAIPYEYYEKYGVRKYGFHGLSHRYVAHECAKMLDRDIRQVRLITCHLGKGCSIAAINHGDVLDTSMGMTPLPGLVMATRCGDIDPAVVLYLARQGMPVGEIDDLLNRKSGLLGVAGINSGDMRDILDAGSQKNPQATRAVSMFVHRLVSYIGSYFTILDGADAVAFSGGIGENSPYIRSRVVNQLGVLGCHMDENRNHAVGERAVISDDRSTLKAFVVPTDEEMIMAKETIEVLTQNDSLPDAEGCPT